MFKRKFVVLLMIFVTLLVVFPVSAADNLTSSSNDYLAVSDDLELSNQLDDVKLENSGIDDNLTAASGDSDDGPVGENNVTYVMLDTNINAENFTQYAVDFKAGERGGNFNLVLVDVYQRGLANKTVKIGFNGHVQDVVTGADGQAHMQVNLASSDKYTFVAMFMGDNSYKAVMKVYTFKINKKPISISANAKTFKSKAKTKKYTVTLKTKKCSSADGKVYLKSGKKVTLKLNGKTYSAKTDKKGKATFNLKITKKKKFKATVKFAGDNTYKSATKTAYITIK